MMRSESTSALGQPRETKEMRGAAVIVDESTGSLKDSEGAALGQAALPVNR
jgi:hypothetical protein